jgi:hypothetical protein
MNTQQSANWPLAGRIAFRFLFAYLVFYFLPFPAGLVNPSWIAGPLSTVWSAAARTSAALMGIQIPSLNNGGSGDTTLDQLKVVCMLSAAALVAIIWSITDRRRPNYCTLHSWSRIWWRYALALCMLTFGSVKVLMVQFEPPSYGRLIQPIGELSPMALLWTFMGSSVLYTTFTGAAEVLGGVLLFFRRTTTLGALLDAAILLNVVMLNLSYDVPVKLGSIHCFILSLVLLAPDARRLADVFVFNRPTNASQLTPLIGNQSFALAAIGARTVFIISILTYLCWDTADQYRQHIAMRETDPIAPEGHYLVESFLRDGAEVRPANPDEYPWTAISLRNGTLRVRTLDGTQSQFDSALFNLALDSDERGIVTGTVNGHRVEATLKRNNASDMPLMSRGFHWVSEAPYLHMFKSNESR